jgi:hypothetical protein
MSYFDPYSAFSAIPLYQPMYEQTKNEIEKCIMSLEGKLRKVIYRLF